MTIASKQIREEFKPEKGLETHIFYTYELQEIHQILISIAIQLRMIDDIFIQQNKNRKFAESKIGIVGEIDVLTLRETCNKIIHAQKIEICLPEHFEIILNGSKFGNQWEAKFRILDFVKSAINLTFCYSEDWELRNQGSDSIDFTKKNKEN